MAKELDDYEMFYEEVGVSELRTDLEESPEEEDQSRGLNEEDVAKLTEDMQEPNRFDEQLENHRLDSEEELD